MTNILLPAGIVILLFAANIVTLIVVLCRKRQRKSPYRGLFTTVDTAIKRETDKVLGALHASISELHSRISRLQNDWERVLVGFFRSLSGEQRMAVLEVISLMNSSLTGNRNS